MTNSLVQAVMLNPAGTSGGTSAAADFTGADLIVATYIESFAGPSQLPFSDSLGNTWSHVSGKSDARVETKTGLWYCLAPTVGSSQTFTIGGGTQFQKAAINGYKVGVGFLSNNSGASTDNTSSIQPGSITASASPDLIIVMCGMSNTTIPGGLTIDLGFDISNQSAQGTNYGMAQAFLFQSTASAVNPTISSTGTMCMNVKSYAFQMGPVGVPFCQILGS